MVHNYIYLYSLDTCLVLCLLFFFCSLFSSSFVLLSSLDGAGEEAVFVFSPDAESHAIILQHYGDWPAVTASWPGGCFSGTEILGLEM